MEALTDQRILFASLASSAFLIYLDPFHGMNTVRTLVVAHLTAAVAGVATFWLLGHSYPAAAAAMVMTIASMVLLDAVHPPAVATSLSFAFRTGAESELVRFGLALSIIAILVVLERGAGASRALDAGSRSVIKRRQRLVPRGLSPTGIIGPLL